MTQKKNLSARFFIKEDIMHTSVQKVYYSIICCHKNEQYFKRPYKDSSNNCQNEICSGW